MMPQLQVDFAIVREPLGFIKILEWLTAAFSFVSCGGYSGTNTISITCGGNTSETFNSTIIYPFRLNQVLLVESNSSLCNHTIAETHQVGDHTFSAELYVGMGVTTFIYCLVTLLFYVFYMNTYTTTPVLPNIDFLVTVLFAVLWLISASLWAFGVQKIIDSTDSNGIITTLALCKEQGVVCEVPESANIRNLHFSVNCGFLNVILWAVNTWFNYKETTWHNMRKPVQYHKLGLESRWATP